MANKDAVDAALVDAHQCWFGSGGLGPERYLYRSVLTESWDHAQANLFATYWGVARGPFASEASLWVPRWQALRASVSGDSHAEYSRVIVEAATFNGTARAFTAASKYFFNLFPNSGYVMDSRAKNSAEYISTQLSVPSASHSALAAYTDYPSRLYGSNAMQSLRLDLVACLSTALKELSTDASEEHTFAGRIIDKYLFHYSNRPEVPLTWPLMSQVSSNFLQSYGSGVQQAFSKAGLPP